MKPPICAICNQRFAPDDGGIVSFANYKPLPERMVGHPNGLVWFCKTHIGAAKALSGLNSGDAIQRMKE